MRDSLGCAVFAVTGLISVAGIALNLVYNCTLYDIILILPVCLAVIASFLVSWRAGLLTGLLCITTLSWFSVSFIGEWNYAAMCFAAATVVGAAVRYFLFGGSRRAGVLSGCLMAIALLAAAAAPFTVWRYATFEALPGAGYINQSVSALGVSSNAVIANVLNSTIIYAAWAGIFLAVTQVRHRRVFLRGFRRLLLVVTAMNAGVAYLQLNRFPTLLTTGKWSAAGQATGLMIDGNSLGMFSAIIIAAAPIWLPRRLLGSPSALLSLALSIYCILAAGSRSAFALALVFCLVLVIALFIAKLRRGELKQALLKYVLAPSVVIVLLAGVYFVWLAADLPQPPLLKRLAESGANLLSGVDIDSLSNARITMWGIGWGIGTTHPFAGIGPGAFFCEAGNFAASRGVPFRMIDNAMNLYLHLFAELGVLALIAIVVFLWFFLRGQWRKVKETGRTREIAILSFIVSLAAVFFIGPHILLPEPMFAAMLFIGLAAGSWSKTAVEVTPKSFVWKSATAWLILVVFAAAVAFYTSASLHPTKQWQRLHWHIEAGFGQMEMGDIQYQWSESLAVMTLKSGGRFLHLKCRAGDEQATAFRQETDIYLAGRRLGSVEFTGSRWRDIFFRIDEPSSVNEKLVLVSDPPYIPDVYLGNGDLRRLGPAVAEARIIGALEDESYGFWPLENDGERDYRWSQAEGYLRLVRCEGVLRFQVRAAHPDLSEKPVVLYCDINGVAGRRIELADGQWHTVAFSAEEIAAAFTWNDTQGPVDEGYFHVIVDRTWVPAETGGSDDHRELGVAVSRFTFVPTRSDR
jgi:O-antigen ligase